MDRFGCIDTDGDGHSDGGTDAFPNDKSQHMDVDGDGFGDNANGSNGDACPNLHGSSMHDRRGCYDSDGDGYSNPDDDWGLLEGADFFPADETQWGDYDGDGFGDNSSGNKGDACPIVHGLSMDDRFDARILTLMDYLILIATGQPMTVLIFVLMTLVMLAWPTS